MFFANFLQMYKLCLLFTNIWPFFLFFSHFSVTLQSNMSQPLAERLRPRTLDDYIGQQHLVGEGAVLRKMIDAGRISSFILWGPPGVGKTTLAQIIAHRLETPF